MDAQHQDLPLGSHVRHEQSAGLALHTLYGAGNPVLKASIGWFDLVGNGYVQLLQMIVIPLVFASILSAVAMPAPSKCWAHPIAAKANRTR